MVPEVGSALRPGPERLKRGKRTLATLRPRDPSMVDADPDPGKRETHRGDAARRAGCVPVAHHAVRRVGFIPQIIKSRSLHVIEKSIIVGKRPRVAATVFVCVLAWAD